MKRSVLIILGIVVVVLLLAVWVYVLFFNTTTPPEDTFTDLNFDDTTDVSVTPPTEEVTPEPTVDVTSPKPLRQLTTGPVVGFAHVQADASSTPMVYYIEAGTGHTFSIDTKTGEETRVSGTTIPMSSAGAITPDGQFVMVQSGSGPTSEFVVGEISTTSDQLRSLRIGENIVDFVATVDNTFLYAVQSSNAIVAKEYFPLSNTSEIIFSVPFREATIAWGNEATAPHYVYPKTTSRLEGFLYEVVDGLLHRLPIDGYGLSAVGGEEYVLYGKQVGGFYQTVMYNKESRDEFVLDFDLLPEKCAVMTEENVPFLCASAFGAFGSGAPDNWYSGSVTHTDNVWEVWGEYAYTEQILDVSAESGRQLDIINLLLTSTTDYLYFQNKVDETLWVYERFLPSQEIVN